MHTNKDNGLSFIYTLLFGIFTSPNGGFWYLSWHMSHQFYNNITINLDVTDGLHPSTFSSSQRDVPPEDFTWQAEHV
jgi:hypothetical protein